jgi:hypothetical protein
MRFSRVDLGALALTLLALGCSGGQHLDLGVEPGEPTHAGNDGGNDDASAAPAPDAASGLQFTSPDSAPPDVTFDCKPGTYAGTFETHVSSDAGGLFAFYSLDIKGTLSIAIVGEVTRGTGEVPTTTYSIAPGAELAGVDQSYGGTYGADLVGQLDCASKTFTGTLSNAIYHLFLDAGVVPMEGSLSGTYNDGDAGVPQLTGTMMLSSPNLPSLGAVGPWTASLQ